MFERRRVHLPPYWRLFARRWLALIIFGLAMMTFVFGLSGFLWQYNGTLAVQAEAAGESNIAESPPQDWSIPIFKTFQLFVLDSGADDDSSHPSNWLLIVARLSAATLFLVVSSAVITRIANDARRLPRNLTRRNHVVICGLGQIGLQLLDDLHERGRVGEVVIIESNPSNPWLENAASLGATIITDDATRPQTLLDARAQYAAEVFIVSGDDGVNLEVVAELSILRAEQSETLKNAEVYVHILDVNFATTLRPYCSVLHDTPDMHVQVFNVTRTAATRLVTHKLWPFAPKNKDEVAHFVIIGFGAMGQTLAVQLAQLAHFPNCKRSRFTIADEGIEKKARKFLSRFSRFTASTSGMQGVDSFSREADAWSSNSPIDHVCNAEFVELQAGRSDDQFAALLAKRFNEQGVKPVVFICGQQDRENFESAVQLREHLSLNGQPEIPIFVWLPRQPALAETLTRADSGSFFPFGENRASASYDETTSPMRDAIGIEVHEDYGCRAVAAGVVAETQAWSSLRDEFRESNRAAADHLIIKLATLGLELHERDNASPQQPVEFDQITMEQKEQLAEMEHYRWVAERLLAGWRYAAKGKTTVEVEENKKRKLNHNLVPWEQLGPDKEKDFVQVETVLRECQKDRFIVQKATIK